MPDIYDHNWDFRLYCATGGTMRLLANLLEDVLSIAGGKDASLTLKDFEEAYEVFRFRPELKGHDLFPFAPDFLTLPRKRSLSIVEAIGTQPHSTSQPITPRTRATRAK